MTIDAKIHTHIMYPVVRHKHTTYEPNLSLLYKDMDKTKSVVVGKSIIQVPDTGTQVLDNTRPFWRSSIVC